MTDETFGRIAEFVKRNAIPPTEYLPKGFPVKVVVDAALADDKPELLEDPYVHLRVSKGDFADLKRRLDAVERPDTEGLVR